MNQIEPCKINLSIDLSIQLFDLLSWDEGKQQQNESKRECCPGRVGATWAFLWGRDPHIETHARCIPTRPDGRETKRAFLWGRNPHIETHTLKTRAFLSIGLFVRVCACVCVFVRV